MDPIRPWWQSQKIMVFLIVLGLMTGALLTLVLTGHLELSESLVRDWVLGVSGTGSAVVLGRAGEGAAAALRRPRGGDS